MTKTFPPGPTTDGQAQREHYGRDPIGFLDECQAKYGDIYMLKLVERGMVFVTSPELAKALYLSDPEDMVAGEAKIAIFGKIMGKASVLLLDGRPHAKRRQLLVPRFRGESVVAFAPLTKKVAEDLVAKVPRGAEVALHPLLHAASLDIIFDALFRDSPKAVTKDLFDVLYLYGTQAAVSPLLMRPDLQVDNGPDSPWGNVVRVVKRSRELVGAEVKRRREAKEHGTDITGLMMDARGEDSEALSDDEVVDEILTTLAVGHDTSSNALTWICYGVYTHPEVLQRLRTELANWTGDLDELPYLDCVVREALRLYSVIPNGSGRLIKRELELGGYTVPEKAMASVVFHTLHRRPELFADPNAFRPERFLEKKYSPYEWVPFGGGARRCLGMPFAMVQMKVVLATIVQALDLQVVGAVRPVWRGMFLTPSDGLRVRAS